MVGYLPFLQGTFVTSCLLSYLKRGLLLKERICSPFIVDPFSEGRQNNFYKLCLPYICVKSTDI